MCKILVIVALILIWENSQIHIIYNKYIVQSTDILFKITWNNNKTYIVVDIYCAYKILIVRKFHLKNIFITFRLILTLEADFVVLNFVYQYSSTQLQHHLLNRDTMFLIQFSYSSCSSLDIHSSIQYIHNTVCVFSSLIF